MSSTFLKLPPTDLTGALDYQGTWNATTNSPTLASGVGTKGQYYVVSIAGSTNLDGITTWSIGDWAVFNGSTWNRIDNSVVVSSVFGRTGAVVAATNDYTWAQIDKTTSSLADITIRSASDLTSGTLPDARIQATGVTQHVASIDHNSLLNTHNLTTDIDHDALTNFVANEHIDWTAATQNFLTTGNSLTIGTQTNTATPAVTLFSKNSGYAAPSNVGSLSDGDKWVFWNASSVYKGAIGFSARTMWFQSTEGTSTPNNRFKFYAGSAGSPIEILNLGDNYGFVWNDTGMDLDFRIEGDTDPNLFVCDGGLENVGIGLIDPDTKLEIFHAGNQLKLSFDGTDNATFGVDTSGNLTITPSGDKVAIGGYVEQEGIYAEIYAADASTAQSIPTGVGYTKITGFTTNGLSSNCTADASNDKITITKIGIYKVTGAFNGNSGTNGVTFRGAAFLNGVEQNQVHWKRKYQNANDSGSSSFTGFIDVTSAPWDLDFRVRHDNGGSVNWIPEYINLNVEYMGET